MGYIDLISYYTLHFNLTNIHTDHHLTLSEINSMMPFERDIYIMVLENYLKEKENATQN